MTLPPVMPADAPSAARRPANLRQLLAGLTDVPVPGIAVTDITVDSRAVVPGGLFVAVPGGQRHGIDYAADAIRAGAAVVLWEPVESVTPPAGHGAPVIAVPGLKGLVGRIADRFFDNPSARMEVAGITGTNGKTTTACLVAGAMSALGQPTAYAGTLGYGLPGQLRASSHTTPDCIAVHRRLAELSDAGATHVGMEVSSHALDQGRVDAVRFHTAVFTNLTRDHLDYHGSMGAYGAAKARLFHVPGLDHAVINVGDPFGDELVRALAGHAAITAYHVGALGDIAPARHRLFARSVVRGTAGGHAGLTLHFDGSWGAGQLHSRLLGGFNAENLLAALAVLLGWEVPLERAVHALGQCPPPPGRMEALPADGPLTVVDYAHTPDALAKALKAVREHAAGRVICVFGCGGERDRGKRPLMGAIAESLADSVIVTDDNPRRESSTAIIADIVGGMHSPDTVRVEPDRARAIRAAIGIAVAGDAVLIAGKGHEDYQDTADGRQPFSDRAVALAALGGWPS